MGSGLYYIRSGNRCRPASWEEVRRLYQTSESIYYDEIPISKATLGSLDIDHFRTFLKKYLAISPEESLIESYLENLKLITPNKKDLDGKILDVLENTSKFLGLYIREEHRIKGFEPELYPEIPMAVLREGVVNAIVHRDYAINAPIRLFIFKDRIKLGW
jgi:ATP-dependent DNA helicase RecG